jgi:molybdate transport system ATP-binding protein
LELSVNLRKTLHTRHSAFDLDIRFSVQTEVLVLMGASGAGKSLTLQAIAGLIQPDAGRISLDGRVLYDAEARINLPARRRRIGHVFQDYALFPHMTVYDNVAASLSGILGARLDAVAHERVAFWLEAFEIAAIRHSYPSQVSGGQRQRVALARALVAGPTLLLLDEPFSALDPRLRTRMRDELLQLRERIALPLVIVSHDEIDVHTFSAELIEIDAGRVVPGRRPASA